MKSNFLRLALMGLSLGAIVHKADAQAVLPEQFRTDNGTNIFTGGANYAKNNGSGIGFSSDPAWTAQPFINAQSSSTAQTVYNRLQYGGASFGVGDRFQIGVHAISQRDGGATDPVTIYASLYRYDPNSTAGVPIDTSNPLVSNLAITVNNSTGDTLYYSSVGTLNSTLTSGGQYVIAFAPKATAGATPANWAIINRRIFSLTGLDSSQQSIFTQFYRTNSNDVAGAGLSGAVAETQTGPIGYRLYAASVPAPGVLPVVFMGAGVWSYTLRRRLRNR